MPRRPGRPAGPRPHGDEIRRLRIDRGFTAAELGAKIGYSQDAIWLAERNGSMSDLFASRLAKALSTPDETVTVADITRQAVKAALDAKNGPVAANDRANERDNNRSQSNKTDEGITTSDTHPSPRQHQP